MIPSCSYVEQHLLEETREKDDHDKDDEEDTSARNGWRKGSRKELFSLEKDKLSDLWLLIAIVSPGGLSFYASSNLRALSSGSYTKNARAPVP